ncbi:MULTISPECIES: branched-chain amino acid transporter permease [Tsukamurella]|uniref:AzlD domain-containing protein n=1 Tax=Tsukamurella strandjordii TaxID=147577 RepID=A0AA90NEZ2_9ACTN|nr:MULTISPECIES: AzlD domain-containing protein [Tsukamurella]MDP0397933.1 AzlD domain-containing protein [Tsukamurella strandjordii]GIZ98238.1 putative branched-chain amino acid transport protein [Tsukamurella sp. TY48]
MPSVSYLLAGVAVTAAVTFALRLAPFGLASVLRGSPLLADFGRWMPAGAAIVLAAYCLASVDYAASAHGIPQLAGVAATAAVHLARRNAVLSIVAGTGVCIALSYALG